ncbi:hypothetical protein QFZ34_001265 [Phyllobacterium ifriqiyense]|uniref:Uncharacterized protein n=1 Tax=Phyllobacterium ifriqiyense TaxID=314238 RepID=A0ABU0S5Q0_9HYPH|nr:hypothetical protein [Phyllobacterium ifriqiyense]MDQ0996088.1 hypothetical protein [Phyllobacterium ifriqiyense]
MLQIYLAIQTRLLEIAKWIIQNSDWKALCTCLAICFGFIAIAVEYQGRALSEAIGLAVIAATYAAISGFLYYREFKK